MTQHPDHIQRYVRWHGQAMAELERQFNRLIDLLQKANFNPAQLRIPAGRPGGGEWTDGETGEPSDGLNLVGGKPLPPGSIRSLFRDYGGHHIFPLAEALLRGNLLSPDAVDVLSQRTIVANGELKDQGNPDNPHRGRTTEHRAYGVAVREATDRFIKENGIDRNNPMTGEQAQRLVETVRNSNDPRISRFLTSIDDYMRNDGISGRARPRGIGRGGRGRE